MISGRNRLFFPNHRNAKLGKARELNSSVFLFLLKRWAAFQTARGDNGMTVFAVPEELTILTHEIENTNLSESMLYIRLICRRKLMLLLETS